jgi:hypothetical protein
MLHDPHECVQLVGSRLCLHAVAFATTATPAPSIDGRTDRA